MKLPAWQEEPISRQHDRTAFDCGVPVLNAFFQHHARRSHERGGAKTFVVCETANPSRALGFYSLSPASIVYDRAPETVRRGLARHEVPMFRLARLAVDKGVQNKGLGGQLLLLAGRRCMAVANQVGGVALLIDAKDSAAADWYRTYGAVSLNDQPLTLILPFETMRIALEGGGRFSTPP